MGVSLMSVLLFALAIAASVLLLVFVLVPVFKGLGWLVANLFRGLGWLVAHVFEFIGGMIGDVLRFIGSIIALVVLAPMALLNVVIGRWSAAGHFADSVKRECKVAAACVYRVGLRRPLKLFMLHGLLEGVEERVPEAMAAAPTRDTPRRRTGQFDGYTIVGSLKGGGSGAKLYIAEPDDQMRSRYAGMPDRVVIKSFALSEGSSLPQILRESRALESAKQLGLVFDHGMDAQRFHYVMPYHAGEHLGIVTRQLHGESDGQGLGHRQLGTVLDYGRDLVATLATYHRGGLWHKDVKPENIIINDGRAQLVDLGLVTPLRSAMTLTTHGTEYFRDPELVRQALRGVKVHQINGAKFDIYAAGAVLYFMIENTFPPHGALSRFVRRSPDAMRWVIRRAMADYSHRYATSDEMLADLDHIAASANPFDVKPVDLPSMSGSRAADVSVVAGSPVPPDSSESMPPLPPRTPDRTPEPAVAMTPSCRPQITVTNWWTGAYRVDDPGTATVPADPRHAAANAAATAFRHDTAELRHRVRTGAMSARKAAKEQVRTARKRAKEIRRRARQTRHKAIAERQPSGTLAVIVLAAIAIASFFGFRAIRDSGDLSGVHVRIHDDAATSEELDDRLVHAVTDHMHTDRPVLLVPLMNPDYSDRLPRIVERFRTRNHDVIIDDELALTARFLLDDWNRQKTVENDQAIEDLLAEFDLWGLLDVQLQGSTVSAHVVHSSQEDAVNRRYIAANPPTSDRPYLLINNHPVRHDPFVDRQVDRYTYQLARRGWNVVVEDEMEADLRSVLPIIPMDDSTPLTPRASALLDAAGFGGILHVHAAPGSEQARTRVMISAISLDDAAGDEFNAHQEMMPDAPLPPFPPYPRGEITVSPDSDAIDSSAGSCSMRLVPVAS